MTLRIPAAAWAVFLSIPLPSAAGVAREVPGVADPGIADPDALALDRAHFRPNLSVRELLTEPLSCRDAEDILWVRTRDLRARFDADAVTVYPVLGSRAQREWPTRFTLESVASGGASIPIDPGEVVDGEGWVDLRRAGLTERYLLELDSIEQTFVFEELPARGELVLELAVDTELAVAHEDESARFVHAEFGELRYGSAFAYDARGKRTPVQREARAGGFRLRVPADFVESAVLPLVVDPPIRFFTNGHGIMDDANPDSVYTAQGDRIYVVWQEFTSHANSDVYMTSFTTAGGQGNVIAIDVSDNSWIDPAIAIALGPNRALVAASMSATLSGLSRVAARVVDLTAFAPEGPVHVVSSVGDPKLQVDVGGTNRNALNFAHFCVSWEHAAPTGSFVEYATLDWDGTLLNGPHTVGAGLPNCITPALSQGLGDTVLSGDEWTLVWISDADDDGRGQLWGKQILWNGSDHPANPVFPIDLAGNLSNPSVSSKFDEELVTSGERPAVVAFEVTDGPWRGIEMRVIDGSTSGPRCEISAVLEDYDPNLARWEPQVVCTGNGFVLAYLEEKWSAPGSGDRDVYMVSGHVREHGSDWVVALGERHALVSDSPDDEHQLSLSSIREGTQGWLVDAATLLWMRQTSTAPGFGTVEGALLEPRTDPLAGSEAIGVQFCDANPNSAGVLDGRTSSWLAIYGGGSIQQLHQATCFDMPPHKTGLLFTSLQPGDIDLFGGGMGRLCLVGGLGRFNGQVGNSGPEGVISTFVNPQMLPQPGGLVGAVPGVSWYFQMWHRDIVAGVGTWNFSNACEVVFEP